MGLDITAYQRVEFVSADFDENESGYPVIQNLYPNPDFIDKADGLARGQYRVSDEQVDFRAGSYSGYNDWRDWLCLTFHKVTAKDYWKAKRTDGPFSDLINFSDCEGLIGPHTSAKLASEFAANRDKAAASAKSMPEYAEWYIGQYDKWMEAFVLAAGGGAVAFH